MPGGGTDGTRHVKKTNRPLLAQGGPVTPQGNGRGVQGGVRHHQVGSGGRCGARRALTTPPQRSGVGCTPRSQATLRLRWAPGSARAGGEAGEGGSLHSLAGAPPMGAHASSDLSPSNVLFTNGAFASCACARYCIHESTIVIGVPTPSSNWIGPYTFAV